MTTIIIYLLSEPSVAGGAGAYLQWSLGKRYGTNWTGSPGLSQGSTDRTNNQARTHSPLRTIQRDQVF